MPHDRDELIAFLAIFAFWVAFIVGASIMQALA